MRTFVAGLLAACLPTVALADAPPPSVSQNSADAPPASVWQLKKEGGYEHLLTGLRCPATLGVYHRRTVAVFDKFGLDVGCDYSGASAGVSYYLTHRNGSGLEEAMVEAKHELENGNAARHTKLVSETKSRAGDVDWIIATYDGDGGMRDVIWLGDLSGWTLEYRATYHIPDEARVSADIRTFAADVHASVGARLQTCAKATSAARDGKPITDQNAVQSASMMTSILGGAMQSVVAEGKAEEVQSPTACVERAGSYAGYPFVFSRSIGSDGSDMLSDVVTVVAAGTPINVDFAGGGLAGLVADKPGQPQQWTATYDHDGQTLIFGYFSGRPTIDQMGDLVARMLSGDAKPVGGYSAKGKDISIMMPPK